MSKDDPNDRIAALDAQCPAPQDHGTNEVPLGAPDIIRLHAEELSVVRELVETGRVHVRVVTHEHEELVDVALARNRIEVERVIVGRQVDAIPPVRQDGDTTIVSIVEEIVVMERRLMLKEELHIKRVHTTEQHQERVLLRHQEALVTRVPVEGQATDSAPLAGAESNAIRKEQDHGV